jgi:hypothetical protein
MSLCPSGDAAAAARYLVIAGVALDWLRREVYNAVALQNQNIAYPLPASSWFGNGGVLMLRAALVVTFVGLASCATIEKQQVLQQPTDRQLEAGVGDVVLQIKKQRDLENAFGKADLYGRKTDEGFIEVRYLGTDPAGVAVFARKEVTIQNNETVFNRGPGIYVPNQTTTTTSGMVGTTPVFASSTTTGGGTFIPAPPATKIVLPPESIEIRVDPRQRTDFVVAGFSVKVERADSASVRYTIGSQETQKYYHPGIYEFCHSLNHSPAALAAAAELKRNNLVV